MEGFWQTQLGPYMRLQSPKSNRYELHQSRSSTKLDPGLRRGDGTCV